MAYRGYVRVSTDEQRQGLRAQQDAIQATADHLAGHENAEVVWYLDKGVSGAKRWQDRPGLSALLMEMETDRDVLIVARRDRLARDAVQAMMIDRMVRNVGGRVESADGARWDDTPESRLVRGILDLFSEYERQLIVLRTRKALRAKQQRGEFTGGAVPPGMRRRMDDPRRLEVDPYSWHIIKLYVFDKREEGESFERIARRMRSRSFMRLLPPPNGGKRWHTSTVHRIYHYHKRRLEDEAKARLLGEEPKHVSSHEAYGVSPG